MALLGYALFSGQYGSFTVPVFEAPNFAFTSGSARILRLTKTTFGSMEWNYCDKIFSLVPNPPIYNPFTSGAPKEWPFAMESNPIVEISAVYSTSETDATFPHDYYGELLSWLGGERHSLGVWWRGGKSVVCIFKFPDEGNKYYLAFSEDNRPSELQNDYVAEFVFGESDRNRAIDSITIQPNPVIIGDVELPNGMIIEPDIQYFYKRQTNPNRIPWHDWVSVRLRYPDGTIGRYLSADDLTATASDSSITELSLSNSLIPWAPEKIQIEYQRPDILENNWALTLESKEYPGVTATISYRGINLIGNIYTPEISGGGGSIGGFPSTNGGGGGNFGVVNGTPESSDPIAPSLPTTGSFEGSMANAGLFVHYAMNANMLEVVGDWLWATDLGLIIAKEVLSILYGSPIESAISLMSYPFNVTALPGVVSNQQELFWGAHGAGFNATAITNPYATIDWGTIQLTEFWGNFLDYAPHTKLELYLPWCTGFVPIDPNECLPGTLRIVTNIELAKGTCLHNVIGNDGRVIATHAGTCGKQLPLTALDTSGKALALVTGAVGAGLTMGAAASGAMGAALDRGTTPVTFKNLAAPGNVRYGLMKNPLDIGSVAREGAKSASKMGAAAKKPALATSSAAFRTPISVQRNGSFTGSTAGLGVQFPYLIISRPTQSVPTQYGHHYGYPSNIYTPLANLRGYTEVGEIHLTGFVCTEEELEEIDSILKGGVIL